MESDDDIIHVRPGSRRRLVKRRKTAYQSEDDFEAAISVEEKEDLDEGL